MLLVVLRTKGISYIKRKLQSNRLGARWQSTKDKGVEEMSFKGNAKQIQEQLQILIKMFGSNARVIDIQNSILEIRR